jgi:hypothetical protein
MSDKLERELKKALRRVEPPAGFAERVLARAGQEEKKKAQPRSWFRWFETSGLRWAAACALCAALAASGIFYQHEQRERQGEEARDQLMLALRITSSKLQIASESVQQMSAPDQREP